MRAWTTIISARTAPARLFDAERHVVFQHGDFGWNKSLVPGMAPGQRALRIAVEKFGSPANSISFRNELSEELEPWRDLLPQRTTFHLRARALEANTTEVEVALLESDGTVCGRNLPLTTQWQDLRVPLASFRHFSHWSGNPPGRGHQTDTLQPRDLAGLNVCFGAWLYPNHASAPHTIEIECIAIE